MAAKLTRLTQKIEIQLHLVTAVPFAVVAPGGQSGNFWIQHRMCVCVCVCVCVCSLSEIQHMVKRYMDVACHQGVEVLPRSFVDVSTRRK
jgi:hypothetical protein